MGGVKTGSGRGRYLEIQDDIIRKYRVDICDGAKCKDDWNRTHCHPKLRRVCKWDRKNSIQSTFTLLHEVGHIETTQSYMRRCEEEYYATVWALRRAQEDYGLQVPRKVVQEYQDYIQMERDRGVRRGGKLPGIKALDLFRTWRGPEGPEQQKTAAASA